MTKSRVTSDASPLTTTSSGARRLQAYRKRLEDGDLVRADILLPRTMRSEVDAIALAEGSRYLETLSALAQYGLAAYRSQSLVTGAAPSLSNCLVGKGSAPLGLLSLPDTPSIETTDSPLSRFLKKRKGDQP